MAIKDTWLKWKHYRWHGMKARSVNSGVRYAHKRAIKRKNRHKGYFWSFYGGD